jgi:SAM-dependent methyltransferase
VSAYDTWAPIYDLWSADMTEDVPFYVELARETGDGAIVELAVGTGRVAVPVTRQTGRRVIGIDSSPATLERARTRAAEIGVELDLREADMRSFELEEPAALVYCPARSLLHLPTWRDKRTVFERVARALRPGGRFAWNAFVFDPFIASENHGAARRAADGIWTYVEQVPADNRIDVTGYVEQPGQTPYGPMSLWWATRSEWEGLVEVADLEVEALYGWFDRRPFDEDSREFVFVTRKPA